MLTSDAGVYVYQTDRPSATVGTPQYASSVNPSSVYGPFSRVDATSVPEVEPGEKAVALARLSLGGATNLYRGRTGHRSCRERVVDDDMSSQGRNDPGRVELPPA